jgi:hypothetical protein
MYRASLQFATRTYQSTARGAAIFRSTANDANSATQTTQSTSDRDANRQGR